jgi:hypothetical protein
MFGSSLFLTNSSSSEGQVQTTTKQKQTKHSGRSTFINQKKTGTRQKFCKLINKYLKNNSIISI